MKFYQVTSSGKFCTVIHRTGDRLISMGLAGCNYRCKDCVTISDDIFWKKEIIESDTEKMANIMTRFCREWKGEEKSLVWFGGVGEPFYQTEAMFDIARRIPDDIRCGVATNGSMLPRTCELNQLFDTIAISLYFADKSMYQEYTGGYPLQPVLDNIKWLVDNFHNNIVIIFVPFTWYYNAEKTHEWCKVVKSVVGDCPRVQIRGISYTHLDDNSNMVRDSDELDFHMKIVRQYFKTWSTYWENKRDGLTESPYFGNIGDISLLERGGGIDEV